MALLPTDFGIPPLPYLATLLALAAATLAVLYRRRPPVTESTVAALAPWMGAGGALYALYQANAVPSAVAPFFGSPAVYVTVGIFAGFAWSALADRPGRGWGKATAPTILALVGTGLLLATVAVAVLFAAGGLRIGWPAAALLVAIVLTAIGWGVLVRLEFDGTGLVGLLVVFGHALDGTSTAVGYDVLGFAEQTPLSRFIIETGAALPIPGAIGGGWLFVLVKLLIAGAVVALFEDYVREAPAEGYLLLGFIVAVGLGPGVHNLVLFTITGGASP